MTLRRNRYDGVLEYWVVVRESGRHSESLEEEETHKSREKAFRVWAMCTVIFHLQLVG